MPTLPLGRSFERADEVQKPFDMNNITMQLCRCLHVVTVFLYRSNRKGRGMIPCRCTTAACIAPQALEVTGLSRMSGSGLDARVALPGNGGLAGRTCTAMQSLPQWCMLSTPTKATATGLAQCAIHWHHKLPAVTAVTVSCRP